MPPWILKAAAQRAISTLPKAEFWNEVFQKNVTRSLGLGTGALEEALRRCNTHIGHLANFGRNGTALENRFSALELGTGWYPVAPIGLYLCGAGEIWTFDISSHLRSGRVQQLLRLLHDYAEDGRLLKFLPLAQKDRLDHFKTVAREAIASPPSAMKPEVILDQLNIHVVVRDARTTGVASASLDLVFSTSVLEYIPRGILSEMLAEFRRVLRPGGITSHYIRLADQYAAFDHSITPFNFLKYTARTWGFLNSPLAPLTRLRIRDYREILVDAGYEILLESNTSGPLEDLKKIKLAPEFRNYSQEDLLVLGSWIAAGLRRSN